MADLISIADVRKGLKRGFADCIETICDYAIGCKSGEVFISVETIANENGYTERWMFEAFRELECKFVGLLKRHPRSGKTSIYEVDGLARTYVTQQREAKQKAATAKAVAAADYVRRVQRMAATTAIQNDLDRRKAAKSAAIKAHFKANANKPKLVPTPEVNSPNLPKDNKTSKSAPLTVAQIQQIATIRTVLGAQDAETPLSVLWRKQLLARNNPANPLRKARR